MVCLFFVFFLGGGSVDQVIIYIKDKASFENLHKKWALGRWSLGE